MIRFFLKYAVKPGENFPGGLPSLRLAVLSPIWQGPALHLKYPDGDTETVVGWCGAGEACGVQIFWTRENPRGPTVCLTIGGDAGLRAVVREGTRVISRGLAFLALAESLIPPEVLEVIGPPPPAGDPPLLPGSR